MLKALTNRRMCCSLHGGVGFELDKGQAHGDLDLEPAISPHALRDALDAS